MGWIQNNWERKINFQYPRASYINLEEIAHALSNTCRFNGHCRYFYSVAQHAVDVAQYIRRSLNGDSAVQLWGLHHDDAEAYLGDMVRPLKYLPEMKAFRQMEKRWMALIAEVFGLGWPEPPFVAFADQVLLATEARDLLGIYSYVLPPGVELLPELLNLLSPEEAESQYLALHRKLVAESKEKA